MRVLVSGFEPFGGRKENPTALLANEAAKASSGQSSLVAIPKGLEVRAVVLPVTFEKAYEKLQTEIRAFDPDVVLAFGMAAGRNAIEIERVAINCLDADIPDNSGFQPVDLTIESGGPAALFTTLPSRRFLEALKSAGLPARMSNTAGTYVCNFLFYRLMEGSLRTRRKAGFIHVPLLPEQAAEKPGLASMSLQDLAKALSVMLAELAK